MTPADRFEEAVAIFERSYLTFIDDRYDYGEIREINVGEIGQGCCFFSEIRVYSAEKV